MNTILQDILAVMQLIPSVLTLIGQVETALGAGNGMVKKAIIMAPLVPLSPGVQSGVSNFIDKTVSVMNSVGKFTHAVQAASAAIAPAAAPAASAPAGGQAAKPS
jgi:hypothetical protein